MLSAPASIPITTVATFASLLAPTDPGSRSPRVITPGIPRRCHNDAACSSPACDTRFGSSKLTATRLNSCDARISGRCPLLRDGVAYQQDQTASSAGHLPLDTPENINT